MYPIRIECPGCHGNVLANLGSLPTGQAADGDRFEVTCPLCQVSFEIGYVTKYTKVDLEVVGPERSAGGSSGSSSSATMPRAGNAPGSNQRADTKNPNNPSFKASGENRANQMNPNNPAYRSPKS